MNDFIKPYVKETKSYLQGLHNVKKSFAEISDHMKKEVDTIQNDLANNKMVIPEIDYEQVKQGKVSEQQRAAIRHRGCAVIRGVFPEAQATDWNEELGEYITQNNYLEKSKEKIGLDNYFSQLKAGAPQIFGLYWSKPQVMARQAESMAATKRFLNHLWNIRGPMGDEFDPNHDYTYADRTRRREPGDTTLGLSPHIDAGSYERWLDPAYQKIFAPIFAGKWRDYDPWKAAYRTQTREFSSPAVASMFRTFQGWTGLTSQGPSDGTLSLIPITNSIAYFLLRALQEDIAADDLCGAQPGRALGANAKWHSDIMGGLISIPQVNPGDTVWWHPDLVHSVADEHMGQDYANVIYIGASPKCAKNEAYAHKQAQAFLGGNSAPDFAAENYEIDFKGRAKLEDLTSLGRAQMCL